MKFDRADIHQHITAEIVSAIENGAGDWRMPWHHAGSSVSRPKDVASDKGLSGHQRPGALGRSPPYRLYERRPGHVSAMVTARLSGPQRREGDHSRVLEADPQNRFRRRRIRWRGPIRRRRAQSLCPIRRSRLCVFNASQVDGYPPHDTPRLPEAERIARADAFFAALDIPIITGGNKACYRPAIDTVFMPAYERFLDAASYYSCLGYETGHATGAKHRLDRDLTGRFGSATYAMDEVTEELTSSFVMADLGIGNHPVPNMPPISPRGLRS